LSVQIGRVRGEIHTNEKKYILVAVVYMTTTLRSNKDDQKERENI